MKGETPDHQMGQWLVQENLVDAKVIDKCLALIEKAQSQGKKTPPILNVLVKNKKISADDTDDINQKFEAFLKDVATEQSTTDKATTDLTPADEVSTDENSMADPEQKSEDVAPEIETEESHGEAPDSDAPNSEASDTEALHSDGADSTEESSKTASAESESETLTCAECHSSNDSDATVCNTCGASLVAPDWTPCVFCGQFNKKEESECSRCHCDPKTGEPSSKTLCCVQCSSPLRPDDALCIQCGTEVARQKKPVWVVVGWSLAGLQCAVLCVGLFFFSEDKGFKQADVIPVEDHFSKVPARVIDEDDLRKELNEEEKAELKAMIALAQKEKWSQADDLLEASELESSFAKLLLESILNFHAERREDVMALSSSLPGHNGLQLLSSALRFSKAVDLSKSFEIEKAYLTLLPSLEASGTSGLQYFWAGTLAMNLQDLSSAEKYFEAALQAQSPVVQSHLFLGLLKEEGDKAASAAHFEALLEGVEDKPKVEKILKAYQEGV